MNSFLPWRKAGDGGYEGERKKREKENMWLRANGGARVAVVLLVVVVVMVVLEGVVAGVVVLVVV